MGSKRHWFVRSAQFCLDGAWFETNGSFAYAIDGEIDGVDVTKLRPVDQSRFDMSNAKQAGEPKSIDRGYCRIGTAIVQGHAVDYAVERFGEIEWRAEGHELGVVYGVTKAGGKLVAFIMPCRNNEFESFPQCPECGGKGELRCTQCDGDGDIYCSCPECENEHCFPCKACRGNGTTGECNACEGTGKWTKKGAEP